jgi:pilus assembly protein CpaE
MTGKFRTLVIFSDDRFRKECRHQFGKLEFLKIVQEISHQSVESDAEIWEEISGLDPRVIFVELNKNREANLSLLKDLHANFPALPILAVGESFDSNFLIQALRLGVKEMLPRPLTLDALHEAYLRIDKLVSQSISGKTPATIFSFLGCKGGNGCTSIATNFAVSLSKLSKKKILLLDLDVELGDVAGFFGVKNNKFLVQDGTENTILNSSLIAQTILTHPKTGIDLLSFSEGFPKKTRELAGEVTPLLGILQKEYDYILIDASSSLNNLVVSALDSSHLIFLISKCSLPALRNAQRVLHGFEKLGYSPNRIRVLINRYLKGEDVSVKEVEKALNFKVFWSIPNDYKSLIRSIQSGEPLTLQTSSTPLAKSFYDMSAEVLGIKIQHHPGSPGGGLLVKAKDAASKSIPLTTLDLLKN